MSFLERQLEDPARFRRLKRGFHVALAVIVLAEVVLPLVFPAHHHFAFEGWPAFGSVYGFLSCVVIIVVSKWLGKRFLMRPEDHDGH